MSGIAGKSAAPHSHIRRALYRLPILLILLFNVAPGSVSAQEPSPDSPKVMPGAESDSPSKGQPNASDEESPAETFVTTSPVLPASALSTNGMASASSLAAVSALPYGVVISESEPNPTTVLATPLPDSPVRVKANIYPANDVDVFAFTAQTGDRVFAATQTASAADGTSDSVLTLFSSDGVIETVVEQDDDNGSLSNYASSIAGAAIPASGTYYLRVTRNVSTLMIRPYDLYFRLQTGAPVGEVEPNNTAAQPNPLSSMGWVSGTITATSATEADVFSLTLDAGDTVFLSLDMNPERDAAYWNGALSFGLFGDPRNIWLTVNDTATGAVPADPNSEAFFLTVLSAGTYYIKVDSSVATGLGATATYTLSAAVFARPIPSGTCTTYSATPSIPIVDRGTVTSIVTIPGHPQIADLDVTIVLTHTFMNDLDISLRSPVGNENALVTDIGSTVTGANTLMNLQLDDDAAIPPSFPTVAPMILQPKVSNRLNWFNGEDAGGTWTLVVRDDTAADIGVLNQWGLQVCEPAPASGSPELLLHSADFESSDGGYTHSGTADIWAWGTPNTASSDIVAEFSSCFSGTQCWKTNLSGPYGNSSSEDLLSPPISLTGYSGPARIQWAMRYQVETALYDHAWIDAREVGTSTNSVRIFEWLGPTMSISVGATPLTILAESAGWGIHTADISALAGKEIELLFHLDSDTSISQGGLAIDDVQVFGSINADLSLVKSATPTVVAPGQPITFTLSFSNVSADPATGIVLTDVLPFGLDNPSISAVGTVITDTGTLPGYVWLVQDLAPGARGSVQITGMVDPNIASPGVFTNTATIAAAAEMTTTNNAASVPVTVVVPDMQVLGNGQAITNGDSTPSADDDTDFGALALGQTVTHTLAISNNGGATLQLSSFVLGGDTGNAFALVSPDLPATIAPGGSTDFQVRFSPATTGTHGALVTVVSNDVDSTPFSFQVGGTGTNSAPVANAGADQVVELSTQVTLDGSASSDPDGHLPLTYAWQQTGGSVVSLSDAAAEMPVFTSPAAKDTLTFTLVVTDTFGASSAADEVRIVVGDMPFADFLPMIKK